MGTIRRLCPGDPLCKCSNSPGHAARMASSGGASGPPRSGVEPGRGRSFDPSSFATIPECRTREASCASLGPKTPGGGSRKTRWSRGEPGNDVVRDARSFIPGLEYGSPAGVARARGRLAEIRPAIAFTDLVTSQVEAASPFHRTRRRLMDAALRTGEGDTDARRFTGWRGGGRCLAGWPARNGVTSMRPGTTANPPCRNDAPSALAGWSRRPHSLVMFNGTKGGDPMSSDCLKPVGSLYLTGSLEQPLSNA